VTDSVVSVTRTLTVKNNKKILKNNSNDNKVGRATLAAARKSAKYTN